jgi:hypothetical protein
LPSSLFPINWRLKRAMWLLRGVNIEIEGGDSGIRGIR